MKCLLFIVFDNLLNRNKGIRGWINWLGFVLIKYLFSICVWVLIYP